MAEQEEIQVIQLTAKQEKFCYEYCIDFNATQAAIRSGYSQKTAGVIGNENLKKPYIENRIKEMQEDLAKTAGIGKLKVLNEHIKIAYSSIAHLHNTWIDLKEFEKLTDEQKACIEEISTKKQHKTEWEFEEGEKVPVDYTVEYVKIKLYDKQKSLDAINKMLGYDAPIRSILDLNVPQLPTINIKTNARND
jgi:phage terminase small subunit